MKFEQRYMNRKMEAKYYEQRMREIENECDPK